MMDGMHSDNFKEYFDLSCLESITICNGVLCLEFKKEVGEIQKTSW